MVSERKTVRVNGILKKALEEASKRLGMTESQVIREAVASFCESLQAEKEPVKAPASLAQVSRRFGFQRLSATSD